MTAEEEKQYARYSIVRKKFIEGQKLFAKKVIKLQGLTQTQSEDELNKLA